MGQRRSEESIFELNDNETQPIKTVLKGFSLSFERRRHLIILAPGSHFVQGLHPEDF